MSLLMYKEIHPITSLKNDTVYSNIRTWLNNKKTRSHATAINYEKDIKMFFSILRNKNIEDLSETDLKIDVTELMQYQNILKQSGKYKNNSINRYVESVKSLYKFFNIKGYDIDNRIFAGIERLPEDTENIGFMSSDEAKLIAQLALDELDNGLEVNVFILLSASTSIRKTAVQNLKLSDFKKHPTEEDGYMINSPNLFDKGKMVKKTVHRILYDRIVELHRGKNPDDKIFTISASTLERVFKRLCNMAGFDPTRNLSLHSLKKAGIQHVNELTNGDPFAVAAQGSHKNPVTSYNHYYQKENLAGMSMFEEIDDNVFEDLSKEEMVKLLMDIGGGAGIRVKREARKIINKNKKV